MAVHCITMYFKNRAAIIEFGTKNPVKDFILIFNSEIEICWSSL